MDSWKRLLRFSGRARHKPGRRRADWMVLWGQGPKGETLKLGAEHQIRASRLLCVSGAGGSLGPRLSLRTPVPSCCQNVTLQEKARGAVDSCSTCPPTAPNHSTSETVEVLYHAAACHGMVMFASAYGAGEESSSDSFARASSISPEASFFVNSAGALTPSLLR